ncbi:DUF305 domain-containing protein [Pseudonocardia sp. ICBG1293]|uniref:DUF305 domain-containing protein n=1 Tax=Pseudonocardia sp. ICBG1293 TaxID=2844382 RepID=UPI001CCA50B7|nr:DUF305 domain-containing protein [Pseudonocardia sp. ICBG1293]
MTRTTTALAAAALTAALVLTGCAGGGPSTPPAVPSSSADVAFAQGMIPHHEQAVAMARLADGRAGARVRDLAARIEAAQGPEIGRLQGFLADWGAAPAADHHGGHGDMAGMAGMMSDEQMAALGRASGAAFDRSFLQMMIAHHEGAVTMARAELDAGADPRARELAQRIVDAQQAEIAEMRTLLG